MVDLAVSNADGGQAGRQVGGRVYRQTSRQADRQAGRGDELKYRRCWNGTGELLLASSQLRLLESRYTVLVQGEYKDKEEQKEEETLQRRWAYLELSR